MEMRLYYYDLAALHHMLHFSALIMRLFLLFIAAEDGHHIVLDCYKNDGGRNDNFATQFMAFPRCIANYFASFLRMKKCGNSILLLFDFSRARAYHVVLLCKQQKSTK